LPLTPARVGTKKVAMRGCVIVLVLVLVAACRTKAEAPPCGTVAGQFYTIASDELAKAAVDPKTARAVVEELPAMRDALAIACHDGAWSAAVRTCMVAAQDHAAMQACEQQLTDDQRRALDRAARGEPTP
jgi:hypothetical protein